MRRLLLPVLVLLMAAPVQAQRSLAERIEDLRRTSAVRSALVQNTETRAYDVVVRAEAGVVALTGLVPTMGVRARIEEVTRAVPGVLAVRNDIRLDGQPNTPVLDPVTPRDPQEGALADEPVAAPTAASGLPPSGDAPTEATYHVVQQDDTLYSISRRYGTSVEALQRLNGMGRSTTLNLGQQLRIR